MTYWKHAWHKDVHGRQLADRHYSRKTVGAAEYMPPGYKIVLMGEDNTAVWGIQRNSIRSGVLRRDGFECWDNTIFRKENDLLASDLIREAIAICLGFWPQIPRDGLHTFIDPLKVKPTMVRGVKTWGRCYTKSGFEYHSDTQSGLMRFVLSAEKMRAITPIIISRMQPFLPLFDLEVAL
jgi:hypothetical protein